GCSHYRLWRLDPLLQPRGSPGWRRLACLALPRRTGDCAQGIGNASQGRQDMSALAGLILGVATDLGLPLIRKLLEPKIGAAGGALVGTVIKTVAEKAGVEPAGLPDVAPSVLQEAVRETEAEAPELIALYAAGLEGQFALLDAETKEGFWQSF